MTPGVAHSVESDAPTYGPCNAECNGCPECDPGLLPAAENDAETTGGTIAGHVMSCHTQRGNEDWTCTCPTPPGGVTR